MFNDPKHGHIEFYPILTSITGTHQFQLLCYIKHGVYITLSGMNYVFTGASHKYFNTA